MCQATVYWVKDGQKEEVMREVNSFPGLYAETVRPHYLRVTGLDERGKPFDRVFEGFDAVVNPCISNIVKNAILGMLSSLRGFKS